MTYNDLVFWIMKIIVRIVSATIIFVVASDSSFDCIDNIWYYLEVVCMHTLLSWTQFQRYIKVTLQKFY